MISARPVVVVVAMVALAGTAVTQEKADGQRIAELIGRLEDGKGWEAAATELLRIGKPTVPGLVRALRDGLGRVSEEQMWKIRLLDLLAVMGTDAAEAAPELYRSLGELPWQLSARGLHTYAEVAPHAGLWTYFHRWTGRANGRFTLGLNLGPGSERLLIEIDVEAADDEILVAGEEIFREVERLQFRCREDSWGDQSLTQIIATLERAIINEGEFRSTDLDKTEVAIDSFEGGGEEAEEYLWLFSELLARRVRQPEITDEFSLKIARVMLRISRDDPVVVVSYGCILSFTPLA